MLIDITWEKNDFNKSGYSLLVVHTCERTKKDRKTAASSSSNDKKK